MQRSYFSHSICDLHLNLSQGNNCCVSSFYNLESNPNCGRLDFVRCAVFSKGFWDGCVDTARGKQVHDGIVEGWKTWSTHCWFLSGFFFSLLVFFASSEFFFASSEVDLDASRRWN